MADNKVDEIILEIEATTEKADKGLDKTIENISGQKLSDCGIQKKTAVYKMVAPIEYGKFAILDDKEREDCLKSAEGLIMKINAEMELISRN